MTHVSQQIPVGVPVGATNPEPLRQPTKVLKQMQRVLEKRAADSDKLIKEYSDALKSSAEGGFQEEGEQASKEELTALLEMQNRNISDIKEALLRIQHRTYGICQRTGKLIPWERLVACPTAKTCV